MAHWQVFAPDHEFPGQVLVDLAKAVGSDEILPYFEAHGLTNIDPHAWYPMQKLCDVYNEMEGTSGKSTMFDFVSIGMKEAEQAIVPDSFKSLSLLQIFQGISEVYSLNNRGSDIGSVTCEVLGEHHVKIILRIVTPDDLWYGMFYAFTRRFSPKGTSFKVYYDPEIPHRDIGGNTTILHIEW